MRWTTKLRTRLFLNISALIAVALLGLLLGLVSVMQMANTQERLIHNNFVALDLGLKLRQNLGDQLMMMLNATSDQAALKATQVVFQQLLAESIAYDLNMGVDEGYTQTNADYQRFLQAYENAQGSARSLSENLQLHEAFNALRTGLIDAQKSTLASIERTQSRARARALLVCGLLGLTGLALLLIGFVTAHGIARRFGQPIEALAKAADNIGQGNFDITLPVSSSAEMNQLTRRFGSMARALREHQETSVSELVAGQQRLQAVLDSIDDGLLIIDRQGRLEHLNPVAQRQLGWEDERLGMGLGQALQHPELDDQLRPILQGGTLERTPEDLNFTINGELRLLSYSLTPVSQAQGDILGAVMVLHDVTEQRAFERVRSEFILRASHELRTPMTGMHMAFGLLRERLHFPEESRESNLIHTVNEEMQRLMQLINDLLNFSRYQSGLQKLTQAPCTIEDLFARAEQRFCTAIDDKHIELSLDLEEPLPHIQADLAQLDRVMDNLLDNAVRHTPKSGRIRLHARRHADRVIISIEDNGEGIPYGQQARIFEPFVQVGHKKGGAGLGLALCKEIVQLHGGRMGVYSTPGKGSQFYLALPI